MSKSKSSGITPGPWHSGHIGDGEYRYEVVFNMHGQVCTIINRGAHGEEVARLIAVAPELLEAMEGLVAVMNTTDNHIHWSSRERRAVDLARAAIQRAKGE